MDFMGARQMTIFDYIDAKPYTDRKIRLIELFAGYGSQAMALKRIGADFEHYRAVEFDKYAIASYNAVHDTDFPATDITGIHAEDLGIYDTNKYTYFLTYSFPCQDLSCAGKRRGMDKGSGTRSGLLWEVERLLTEIKTGGGELPQILMMENVTQVHGRKNMANFNEWLNFLESLGYKNYWKDMNAKDFGIPQNRVRTFCFSFLDGRSYAFPEPFPLTLTIPDILEKDVDERYYESPAKTERLIRRLIDNGTLPDTKTPIMIDTQGRLKKEPNPLNTCPTLRAQAHGNLPMIVAMRGRYKENPSLRIAGLPTEQRLEPNSQGISNCLTSVQKDNLVLENKIIQIPRGYNKGGVHDICPPISSHSWQENHFLINQYRLRKLTPRECGRLMGVSDEDITKMREVNSDSQIYKQFGNSIVVDVLCAMFAGIFGNGGKYP